MQGEKVEIQLDVIEPNGVKIHTRTDTILVPESVMDFVQLIGKAYSYQFFNFSKGGNYRFDISADGEHLAEVPFEVFYCQPNELGQLFKTFIVSQGL